MTLQDDANDAMRASLDRIEAMLREGVWTYEEVDCIRARDLRIIGELTMSERNLVEQLGLATVRAEQLEDANAAIIAAHDALSKQFARAEGAEMTSTAHDPNDAPHNLLRQGTRFLNAVEALCDWMNGRDLSSDHADQKPADYKALCEAMPAFRAALYSAAINAARMPLPTPNDQEGKEG